MVEQEKNILQEVIERLIKIESKLDGYNEAKRKTYENEKEIIKLQGDVDLPLRKVQPESDSGQRRAADYLEQQEKNLSFLP